MNISEIFYSIQGEGIHIGRPAVFVRLAGCNLNCPWCDTPYAKSTEGSTCMNIRDVVEEVFEYNCPYIVLTGGEPLLQQSELVGLCCELKKQNKWLCIDIETNGTIIPSDDLMLYVNHVTVSPKTAMSWSEWSCFVGTHEGKFHFKFVYEDNYDFICQVVQELELMVDEVMLMSEGIDRNDLMMKDKKLVEICKKTGYRFTPRLQCYLWGNERGV